MNFNRNNNIGVDKLQVFLIVSVVAFLIYGTYYLIANTSYVTEMNGCEIYKKEFKPSYYTTECDPVYLPVTRTVYNSDGSSYTTTDLVFSHNNYYQLYHPEQYLIGVSDYTFTTVVDDKRLYDVLNLNQKLTLVLKYRCWKKQKKSIVSVEFAEQL